MRTSIKIGALLLGSFPAVAQEALTLRDLDTLALQQLSKAELIELLPGAKILRVIANGKTHIWTNDPDGTFIVSSDNRATSSKPATGRGKWQVSDDGRYCILIEWRSSSEDWCRFVFKGSDKNYYTAKALKPRTEKAYKIEITK